MSNPADDYIWGNTRDVSVQLVRQDEAEDLISTEIDTPFALCIGNDGGSIVIEGELPQLMQWAERMYGMMQVRWQRMVQG